MPKSLFPFIWHFVQPYRRKLLYLFAVAGLWAVEMSLRPYTLKLLLDRSSGALDESMSIVPLLFPAAGYLLCEAGINVIFRFYDYVRMFIYPPLQADIIRDVTSYIQGHSYHFFLHRLSGSIATQIRELATGVKEILQISITRFFSHVLAFVFACWTIAWVSPIMALIVLGWTIFFVAATIHLSNQTSRISQETSRIRNQTVGMLTDSIVNILTVRLFSRHGHEISRIEKQLIEQVIHDKKLEWSNLKTRAVQGSSILVMMALLLYTLIYARTQNLVTIGDFGLILTLGISISTAISNLSQDLLMFSELLGKCRQSLQLIETPHEITDAPEARPLVITSGQIIFDRVSFSYAKNCSLFQELSVEIRGGEKVGLVGYSGAGKSTFVHLLVRLFKPHSGSILIDNQNIDSLLQESLRDIISLIPQDPPLFHRSVKENILYGWPQASEEALIQACQQANAMEFIRSLSKGFDTIVGERGVRLSGGQKQRIAIARAFLKNAPILILDEATSSLDSSSELEIQKSLQLLMQNKTVLVIAHRLSTLRSMNRLLVFNQGKIVEEGSHSHLLELKGHYSNLWNIYSGNLEKEVR